jgi:hypothetical protein
LKSTNTFKEQNLVQPYRNFFFIQTYTTHIQRSNIQSYGFFPLGDCWPKELLQLRNQSFALSALGACIAYFQQV